MRRVVLAGLAGVLVVAGACCPSCNCEEDCPVPPPWTDSPRVEADSVQILILPLPIEEARTCLTVDRVEYCAPGAAKRELPSSGDFEIYVNGEDYLLDAYSPSRAPLRTVFVIVGSEYVVGVYADESLGLAASVGTCITCPGGATVCGHRPRC